MEFLLLVAGVALLLEARRSSRSAGHQRASWTAALSTDPTPVAEVVGMAEAVRAELPDRSLFQRDVAVTGVAQLDDGAKLTRTPVSDEPCIWFSFLRQLRSVNSDGDETLTEKQSYHSGGGFRLVDPAEPSGASVVVQMTGAQVQDVPTRRTSAVSELNMLAGLIGRDDEEIITEQFIQPGQPLTVAGRAKISGSRVVLVPAGAGVPFLVTGGTRGTAVRTAQRQQSVLAQRSLLTALAGIGLLVAGVIAIIV
ncbi:hypothetical protein [Nakamurella aerolata]|uniref:Uncharacterized protein n=1 Tax=Nakamurella aerolata TaxID=1656892 RepID=A0A849A549_9ACTN|nr:hypothetical protein [Nakamurella aerolata]NNG34493.1 hypothetical protein [Nakamurella aerolata]